MSDAGSVGGAGGGAGGNSGAGGIGGGNDGIGGSDGIGGNDGVGGNNDSGTTGDSLGGGPNSAESSVGLSADDSATANAPSAADNAAANAALGAAATAAPTSVSNPNAAPTGIAGMVSQALDSFSSVVDGFSTAMDKMGGFAPPGISAAIDFAKDAIGLGKSVMDGLTNGDWSGISDSLFDMASNFTDKLSAAKEALDAIRSGDWESALDAAAKISKTAEKVNNIVDLVQSVQSSSETGNWAGTFQAARAF